MLSLTVFLVWAVASITLVAGDCTVKESFINCIKPALQLASCTDKLDVNCRCRYTYIEADCYDAYCPEETNPDEEARRQCDQDGAQNIFASAINESKSARTTDTSSSATGIISSWANLPSSAVPSPGLPMAVVAAVVMAFTLGLVWPL